MDELGPRITGVEHKVDHIKKAVERMANNHSGNQNVTTVRFEGGAVGVWVCATACLVMLAASSIMAVWMHREFTRLDVTMSERKEEADRMQTYLSAIYAQAPHLRPKEEKQDARR